MHRITVLTAVLLAAPLGALAEHRDRGPSPHLAALAHDLAELSDDLQDRFERLFDRAHRARHRDGDDELHAVVSLGALKSAATTLEHELRGHDTRHPSVARAMRSVEDAWWSVEQALVGRRSLCEPDLESLEHLVEGLASELSYQERRGWSEPRHSHRDAGLSVARDSVGSHRHDRRHDRDGHYHPGHDAICYERH